MMVHWNKVYLVSSYLDDVQSGVDEGPVRVLFVKSVDSLQILIIGVFVMGSNWLAFNAAILISYFDLFYSKYQHLQHSFMMVKDCKPAFLWDFLQPMFCGYYISFFMTSGFCNLQMQRCLQVSFLFVIFLVRFSSSLWTTEGRR